MLKTPKYTTIIPLLLNSAVCLQKTKNENKLNKKEFTCYPYFPLYYYMTTYIYTTTKHPQTSIESCSQLYNYHMLEMKRIVEKTQFYCTSSETKKK